MKPRLLLLLLSGAVVIGLVTWAVVTTPANPVALIRVQDAAGKPVPGAVVKPYALRPKPSGADFFWTDRISVKPLPVLTGPDGVARVPFPHYVVEKLETGEISVTVDHPDFCSGGFPRMVSFAPPENASLRARAVFLFMFLAKRVPARPDPIVLTRGGVLRLSAFLDSTNQLVTNIHPQVTSIDLPETNFWKSSGDGWLTTKRVPEGSNQARIAYFPRKGEVWFSDTINFSSKPGQTNEFQLQLKPGLRLTGKLDESVPRPITNGRVQMEVFAAGSPGAGQSLVWESGRAIQPDGTFTFESVPSGKLEIIAICDGFVSADGPKSRSPGIRYPQVFQIGPSNQQIVLQMEPAATCVVSVFDDQGHPLPDATVGLWPNVIWNGWGSTVFAAAAFNSEDILPTGQRPDWDTLWNQHLFGAKTDAQGKAVVVNLPSFAKPQPFSVDHALFEMPIDPSDGESREARMPVQSGKTNYIQVKLQKKGTDFLRPK